VLMGGVVVEHHVDRFVGRHRTLVAGGVALGWSARRPDRRSQNPTFRNSYLDSSVRCYPLMLAFSAEPVITGDISSLF
jgi:hypothetical protein